MGPKLVSHTEKRTQLKIDGKTCGERILGM
jgi:hypothetical protein